MIFSPVTPWASSEGSSWKPSFPSPFFFLKQLLSKICGEKRQQKEWNKTTALLRQQSFQMYSCEAGILRHLVQLSQNTVMLGDCSLALLFFLRDFISWSLNSHTFLKTHLSEFRNLISNSSYLFLLEFF